MDGGEEVAPGLVVAGGNGAKLLEFGEEVPPTTRRRDRRLLLSHRLASNAALLIAPRAGYAAMSSAPLRMLRCRWHQLHTIKWNDPRRNDPRPPFPSRLTVAVSDAFA